MKNTQLPADEEVSRMYLAGLSSDEIAEEYGVAQNTVLNVLKRTNTPRRTLSEARKLSFEKGRQTPYAHWAGKKLSPKHVEKIKKGLPRGENHWAWKDGKESRDYRKLVVKEKCEQCGSTEKLCIHHRDMDHYNHTMENLGVLCTSCHLSMHKKAYWAAYREGRELPKSNGPVGWRRENSKRNPNA
jgi:predicted DNA-binding protein YlxM (UPF0122 family)